jgi:hypothetical protein
MGFLLRMPEEARSISVRTQCAELRRLLWKKLPLPIVRFCPFCTSPPPHNFRVPGVFAGSVFVSRRARAFLEGE